MWLAPSYTAFTTEGRLANALPLWEVLGAPVHLEVRNDDETPYCASSSNASLASVIDGV